MFWDGTRWVDERRPAPRPHLRPGRLVNTLATIPVLILAPVLLMPYLAASASSPSIQVSGIAVPGAVLAVTGADWPKNLALQLTWDDAATGMPKARTGASGDFSTKITVPANAQPAAHTLTAMSMRNGKLTKASTLPSAAVLFASVSITVLPSSAPADPGVTPAPTALPPAAATRAPDPTVAPPAPTAGSDPTAPPAPTPDPSVLPDPTANPTPDPTPDPGPTLTFDSECGGSSLDAHWRALYGSGDPGYGVDSDFMGNLSQVSVANGYCTITAERANTPSGRAYASACIAPYGTFSQQYGTFEARIRYPNGQGSWPAFWMLPAGQKGPYPEIDVFEAYPGDVNVGGPNMIVGTVHYAGEPSDFNQRTNMWQAVDAGHNLTGAFHTHKIVWTPSRVDFYLDGTKTFSVTQHVPQVRMYPIVTLAMGNYGYRVNSSTPDVLKMDIDYVRVYSQ